MIDANKIKGPLGWSILSIFVLAVLAVIGISSLLAPLLGKSSEDAKTSATAPELEKYAQFVAMDIDRFNGRSAFFKPIRIVVPLPPAPPPPVRNDPPDVPTAIVDSGPPPPPQNYMGPTLIAIIGEEAWFRGSGTGPDAVLRIKIGEEKEGLKLVSTLAPSDVIVEHRNGEYPINLFESNESFFLEEAPEHTPDDFIEEVNG